MVDTKRVLVVDDEKLVCESCTSILSEEGYQVQSTLSARDGLRMITSNTYDLLLVDIKMPEIDGIELLESIREKAAELSIVVITGFPSVETAVRATRLGAMEYIPKPFTPDELLDGVQSALDKREQAVLLRTEELTVGNVDSALHSMREALQVKSSGRKGTIVMDLKACMSCETCTAECGAAHLPAEDRDKPLNFELFARMMSYSRIRLEPVGRDCVPMQCHQCEDPPCAKVCPTGAMRKAGDDGPVLLDNSICIGCKNCMLACPFGSIFTNDYNNTMVKCDLCAGVVGPGEDPVCVRSCPTNALTFMPTEDAVKVNRVKAAREMHSAAMSEEVPQ